MAAITDSKSAHDVIKNPGVTKHTAHFMRWLHWARRLYLHHVINLYLATDSEQMADDKTKACCTRSVDTIVHFCNIAPVPARVAASPTRLVAHLGGYRLFTFVI